MNAKLVQRLAVIGVILLVVGVLAGWTHPFMPIAASAEAKATDSLFNIMIAISTIVFLIVEGALIYSILKFRKKPNDETDGPPMHGNVALEIVWTAIPAVVVLFLSIASYGVFVQTLTPRDNELVIKVKSLQFVWAFQYPHDPAKQFRDSDTLVLPIDQPVRFEITAQDVMHGFWIPEFRIKQDAIPGRVTEVRALPTLKGDYTVVCYELCGSGHGVMRNPVKVVSRDEYETYVASLEIKPPAKPAPGEHTAEWGKYLIVSNKYACAGCHYLPDAQIAGVTGPTWVNLGDRAATRIEGQDARTYMRNSILYPNVYLVSGYPGNVMPQNYSEQMDDTDLESIVDYLLLQSESKSAQK